jgi:pyruvate kinase
LSWGVIPLVIDDKFESQSFDKVMVESIKKNRITRKGSTAILIWGSKIGASGTTDTIRVAKI